MTTFPLRRAPRGLFSLPLLLLGASLCAGAEGGRYWQLLFSYTPQGLSLLKATPVQPTSKTIRTPGLDGAPVQLSYEIEWLDANGQVLHRAPVVVPLGMRVVLNEGPDARVHQAHLPESGVFVVRVEGPPDPAAPRTVRLRKVVPVAGAAAWPAPQHGLPDPFTIPEHEFALPGLPGAAAPLVPAPGPIAALKVHDTGPDENRLVIVVLGDGYTAANLAVGAFSNQVRRFLGTMFSTSPWNVYSNGVNVYRVDIESAQSGADYEDASPSNGGTQKDTYLDAQFWVGGTERCIYLTGGGVTRAFAAADEKVGPGVWDEVLVFVNSTKYGGCGGSVGVSSAHSSSDEIQVHEFGHSFVGLADEYDYGSDRTNCTESSTRNVDCGANFPSVKWDVWVTPGTPIPTPDTSAYDDAVGAFEGASTQRKGVFRPKRSCKMRNLGAAFCPVCKEAHVLRLFERVELLDGASPPFGFAEVPAGGARAFVVQPVAVGGMRYRWLLGGAELAGQTNRTITISNTQVTQPNLELRCSVTHTTALVRAEAIQDAFTWRLNVVDKPSLRVANLSVTEGDVGALNPVFSVTLSFAASNNVTVNYATIDGTATAGEDYVPVAGQLSFAPGETERAIPMAVLGDRMSEAREVFFLTLSQASGATLMDAQASALILDNDSPPSVSIESPAEGALFGEDETIPVTVGARDADGRIAFVEIHRDGERLFELPVNPYMTNWVNAPPGLHTLTAVATDSSGFMATSAPVRINVLAGVDRQFPLISITNAWKYDATTNDYGARWKDRDFDDTAWRGPALALFYNEAATLPAPKNTLVPLTNNGARLRGYYYRTHFNFPGAPSPGLTLTASNLVDDGAVFYLNGAVVGRLRMPTTNVTRGTFATDTPPGGDATAFEALTFPAASLVSGDNVLAVEVHQRDDTSSDTVFGMTLDARTGFAPVLLDASQPTNRWVEQGRPTTLAAVASGSAPLRFRWFRNDATLLNATNATYTINSMSAGAAGDFYCVISNALGAVTSRAATVTLVPDTQGPTALRAVRLLNLTNVAVTFNEPISSASLTPMSNYWITPAGGGSPLVVTRAVLSSGTNLTLTTAVPEPGGEYVLQISNLRDTYGNVIASNNLVPIAREVLLVAADRQAWQVHAFDRDPEPGWWAKGFDDTIVPWTTGLALFDAKRPPGRSTVGPNSVPVRTVMSLTNPPSADEPSVSYYFRTRFELASVRPGTALRLRALVDDGAAFYLNGAELFRLGLPAAPTPLTYRTYASRSQGDAQNIVEGPFDVPAAALRDGENLLAVEVHQASATSSDVSFTAELVAVVPGAALPPILRVASGRGRVTLTWSEPGATLQEADDPAGPWTEVGPAAVSPYAVATEAAQKFYRLRQP